MITVTCLPLCRDACQHGTRKRQGGGKRRAVLGCVYKQLNAGSRLHATKEPCQKERAGREMYLMVFSHWIVILHLATID